MNNLENILENLDTLANQDVVKVETYDTMLGMNIRRELKELRLNNYSAKILNNYIHKLKEENKKLKEELELEKNICSNQAQRIKETVEYVENDMPYLEEPDEEIERCDGTTYMTMKEYDTSILLNKLKGEENE